MDDEEENLLEISNKIGQILAKLTTLNKLVQRKVPDEYPEEWTLAIPGIISRVKDRAEIMIEGVTKRISTKLLDMGEDGKIRIELSRYEIRKIENIKEEEFQAIVEKSQGWREEVERDLASPFKDYWYHEKTAEKMALLANRGYLLPFNVQVCQYFATLRAHPEQIEKAVRQIMDNKNLSSETARKKLDRIIRLAQEKIHRQEGMHGWICRSCQEVGMAISIMAEAEGVLHSYHIPLRERYKKLTEALGKMQQIATIPKTTELSYEVMLDKALKQNGGVIFVGNEHLPTETIPQLKEVEGNLNLSIAYMLEFLLKTVTMSANWKWSDTGTLRAMRTAMPLKWNEETAQIKSAGRLIDYMAKKYIIKPLSMAHVEKEFETLGFPTGIPILTLDMSSGLITRAEYLALIMSLRAPENRRAFQEKLVRDMMLSKYPVQTIQNLRTYIEKTGMCDYQRMKEFLTGPENTKKTLMEQKRLYWMYQTTPTGPPRENLKRKAPRGQPKVEIKRLRLTPDQIWSIRDQNDEDSTEPMDISHLAKEETAEPQIEFIMPEKEPHLVISQQELSNSADHNGDFIKIEEIVRNKMSCLGIQWSQKRVEEEINYQMMKHGLIYILNPITTEPGEGAEEEQR